MSPLCIPLVRASYQQDNPAIMRNRRNKTAEIVLAALIAAAAVQLVAFSPQMPDTALQQADAPPNGVWIDSLDLAGVPVRPAGRGGRAGGAAPATPPPPPVYTLGGV